MKVVPNKQIAVSLFPTHAIDVGVKNNFARIKQKVGLTPLTVVFGSESYRPGWTVYVKAEMMNHQWAKEDFELDGQKFIMMPEGFVVLIETDVTDVTEVKPSLGPNYRG